MNTVMSVPFDIRVFSAEKAVAEGLEAHTDDTGHNKEDHGYQAAGQSERPHPHLRPAHYHIIITTILLPFGKWRVTHTHTHITHTLIYVNLSKSIQSNAGLKL